MKKIIYILAGIVVSMNIYGQQVSMYNHYFYKPFFYNPAFAGNSGSTEAMLLNRSQWAGFSNAPQMNVFTLDGAVREKKIGLGLNLISDKRGINRRVGGSLAYSYRFNINEETYVSLGLSAGVINQSIDYTKAVSESYTDLTLFFSAQQKTTFDGNAGLVFGWKGLELAVSAPQLLGNKINYLDNASGIKASYRQERHYITSLKYRFTLSEEKEMYLAPQFLARIVPNTPLQYDGNLTFSWKNKFWLGATYKSAYAVSANAGITLSKCLDIGYSYEFITGNLANYAGLSHEIMVNYRFGRNKKEEEHEPTTKSNTDYDHKLDSLHHELDLSKDKITENDRKIQELTAKLEQLRVAQEQIKQANANSNNGSANPNSNNTSSNDNTSNNQNASTNTASNNQNTSKNNTNTSAANNNTGKNNNKNTNTPNTNAGNDNTSNSTTSPSSDPASTKVMEDNVWVITSPAADYKNASGGTPKKGFYVVVGTFFYQDFAINEAKRFKNNGFGSSNWMYSNSKQYNYVYTKKASTKQEAINAAKELHKSGIGDAWIKVLE
jgi:type IX secretion system PorP/SprF family membrane protein